MPVALKFDKWEWSVEAFLYVHGAILLAGLCQMFIFVLLLKWLPILQKFGLAKMDICFQLILKIHEKL